MKHFLFVALSEYEQQPLTDINKDTLTDDFDVAFGCLTHYALTEHEMEDIRQPKKPGPFNLTINHRTHLQIWEVSIPDKN